jgi:hypothetical protein
VTLVRDASVREADHTIETWPETLAEDPTGGWTLRARRSLHFAMVPEMITRELVHAGFEEVRIFGDHSGTPLDADTDESIIVVATRWRS